VISARMVRMIRTTCRARHIEIRPFVVISCALPPSWCITIKPPWRSQPGELAHPRVFRSLVLDEMPFDPPPALSTQLLVSTLP
jgi:hypothetical protein